MEEILTMLEQDARLTPEQLAVMCSKEVGDIKAMIENAERDGTILGYKTIIDWEKTERGYVNALIELKVIPARNRGFEQVAEKIVRYPEVRSVYLMSGGFDICVILEGKTMRDIAAFVAKKLAPLDEVTATATHFVMQKYKENGVEYTGDKTDARGHDAIC